jgi:hypothetical protein
MRSRSMFANPVKLSDQESRSDVIDHRSRRPNLLACHRWHQR